MSKRSDRLDSHFAILDAASVARQTQLRRQRERDRAEADDTERCRAAEEARLRRLLGPLLRPEVAVSFDHRHGGTLTIGSPDACVSISA